MRRIYVLDSYFNYFLELPQGRLLIQETCWISTLVLGWYGFFLLRATAFDFCKVKRGKDGGTLRTMSGEKLLKTLPVLQAQVLKFAAGKREFFEGETFETPVKEIWLKAFIPRWMRCWSLTVQPKISTTESSTAVSCFSLEIWSGLSRKFISPQVKLSSFPQAVCLLQWRRD